MFGETVKIKDTADSSVNIEISTPIMTRLNFELWRSGNFRTWRPSVWGGEWTALDQGFIKNGSGEVWYRRSETDFKSGFEEADVRHLDILLYKAGNQNTGENDWGIALRMFFALNGTTSSGGVGYLNQSWALQGKPGNINWDISGRYKQP
jgi:hypothetical protein